MTPPEVKRMVDARGNAVQVIRGRQATTFMAMLGMNTQRPALKDERVRRALNLAMDRWGASKAMEQITPLFRVGGLVRPGSANARTDDELAKLPGYGRNIEAARAEAKRLLAEAGQTNLKLVMVNNRAFGYFGVYVADQLARIGVTVEHLPLDTPQVMARRVSGDYDLIFDSTVEFSEDPGIQWTWYEPFSHNRSNLARVDDFEFEARFLQMTRETDPAARKAKIQALEAYLLNKSYVMPLFWQSRTRVMDARLHGLEGDYPSNYVKLDLADVWLEPANK
jgi:peptide/nickel transport system substrate-binding protein